MLLGAGVVAVVANQCATASSLSAISNATFRHPLRAEQGQWLQLEDVRVGSLLNVSTCDEGIGDADVHVLQGSCDGQVLRYKLRCASGQRGVIVDVAQPGPLYLWVRSVAAAAVRAEYSRDDTFGALVDRGEPVP